MLSISWISLPPETLQRMASAEASVAPCGRRWERVGALALAMLVAFVVTVLVVKAL
jgi:hypothetical protein